jgi:hypothetical protein
MVAGNGKVYRSIIIFFLLVHGYYATGYAEEGVTGGRARTMKLALDYHEKKLDVQRQLRQEALWSAEEEETTDTGTVKQKLVTLPLGYYEQKVSIRGRVDEEAVRPPAEGWTAEHHFTTYISGVYDDNIFNDEDNEKEDFIITVAPQLRFDILGNQLYINTNQELSARYYVDFAEDIYDYIGAAQFVYSFSPRVRAIVSNTYTKRNSLKEIEGTDIFTTNQTIERIDYYRFFTRGEYNLIRGGNSLWLEYTKNINGVRNHGRNNNISFSNQALGIGFTHSFSPRTSVSPAYTFSTYTNRKTETSDYEANGLRLGFEHSFANVLKANGIVGLEYRDYKNMQTEDTTTKASIGLTSLFSRLTTIELDYDFGRFASFTSTSQYDRQRFGMGIYHQLTPLIRTSASSTYTMQDYESGRAEDTFAARIGLDFSLGRRLVTSLSYRFGKKNSTDSTNEYTDNVYMISVKSMLW